MSAIMAEMAVRRLDDSTARRLYREADATRWSVSLERLSVAVEHGLTRVFGDSTVSDGEVGRHIGSLHLKDLALACACADGHEAAWEHFVREYRPLLYKAAAAIDPTGGARDLADGLYAELFGLTTREGVRRSHLEYFHGRSSLATWLRAVLSQRHVDRIRTARRVTPLPDDDSAAAPSPSHMSSPDQPRFVGLIRDALGVAIAGLPPRDRLRLAWYYSRNLTLAEIGRALGEHEATVSRHLTRTRQTIRGDVERRLREHGLDERGVAECFTAVAADPGPLDLFDLLEPAGGKNADAGRSQ